MLLATQLERVFFTQRQRWRNKTDRPRTEMERGSRDKLLQQYVPNFNHRQSFCATN